MIQINLLPEHERKGRGSAKKAARTPSAGGGIEGVLLVLFGFAVFSVVGMTGYYSWSLVHAAKGDYEKIAAEKREVESQIGELSDKAREIQRLRAVFANQWEVLQSLDPPERILWSEKVNMLADLMPSDVFLTEIHLQENVVEIEIQSSVQARVEWEADGRKGPRPEVIKKPVISHTLRLVGLATGIDNVEQFNNVIEFHDALVAHESKDATGAKVRFMDNFNPSIEFEAVEAALYEGVPVNKFIFRLRTRPTGGDPPKPVQTAGVRKGSPSA